MSLIYKLVDLPADGLAVDQIVQPAELDLSADEGVVLGGLRCTGTLIKTDGETVYFQGRIEGRIARECIRCLCRFEEDFALPCSVLFTKSPQEKSAAFSRMPDKVREDVSQESDEAYPILGNQIDLVPVLREQIILATPLKALCREQCAGLCQVCGANLNVDVCVCRSPVLPSEGVLHPASSTSKRISFPRPAGGRRKGSLKKT